MKKILAVTMATILGMTTVSAKTLVVYYSATGTTQRIAQKIAKATGGDLYEIQPVVPYTNDDLDWTDSNSRVSKERSDKNRHVELKNPVPQNFSDYDTIYVGAPCWWGLCAWVIDDFLKMNDFSGKTVIPFGTAYSSGWGNSGREMQKIAGSGNWKTGRQFRGRESDSTVEEWVKSIK